MTGLFDIDPALESAPPLNNGHDAEPGRGLSPPPAPKKPGMGDVSKEPERQQIQEGRGQRAHIGNVGAEPLIWSTSAITDTGIMVGPTGLWCAPRPSAPSVADVAVLARPRWERCAAPVLVSGPRDPIPRIGECPPSRGRHQSEALRAPEQAARQPAEKTQSTHEQPRARRTKQPDNEADRHAEIGRRWRKRHTKTNDYVVSLKRAQLLWLLECRYGRLLPNNKLGRDALQVLLDLGLEGPAAGKLAPWMPWEELCDFIKMIDAVPPTCWSPAALGMKFEVTFEEKIQLRLHHIECFDQPPHVVQRYRLDRKAELACIRRAKERHRRMSVAARVELSPRSRIVLAVTGPEWTKIAAIVAIVGWHGAFRVEPPLKPDALRKAVQRSVDELVEEGFLDRRLEGSGRQTVLWVRKKAAAEATK